MDRKLEVTVCSTMQRLQNVPPIYCCILEKISTFFNSFMELCCRQRAIRSGPSRRLNLRKKLRRHDSVSKITAPQFMFLLFFLPSLVSSQGGFFSDSDAAEDVRCFLQPGGSVANFFINESLPVGSVIGSLMIGGDPSEDGDIHLMLADRGVPVQIADHSKDLILTGRIDKEGKVGQAHISLDIICKKLGTKDPTIVIPVNIRVTDVNDNAPVFIGAPYSVNISEATVVGTIIFSDIQATDDDQKGPFSTLKYTIGPGPHSDLFEFESPLRGSLRLRKPLDYETSPVFNITIVAQDLGSPPQRSKTYLTVHVADSDDQNPAFTRQRYMATLPQPSIRGAQVDIQPERIWAEDRDTGINAKVQYSLATDVPEADLFSIEPITGNVYLIRDITPDVITQPVSLSVFATQVDNPDRRAGTILTVSRRGFRSSQLQFVKTYYNVSVPENVPPGSLITEVVINRKIDENIRFRLDDSARGVFRISQSGQVRLETKLDFEELHHQEYDFTISVTDGEYQDTATIHVMVLNVNDWDPRFRYPQYEFVVGEAVEDGALLGTVEVADGDTGDTIELTLLGDDARYFSIDSSLGQLRLLSLEGLNTSEAHLVVMARDSGNPPRQTSVPVTVKFPRALASASFQPSWWFLLVLIFGGLLGVLILIVICLAVYIHKNKKFREDPSAALPTKLSKLVHPAINGGKVAPLTTAESRNGSGINERNATHIFNQTLMSNKHSRENNGFTCSEAEDDDSPDLSRSNHRRYCKNSVTSQPTPHHHSSSSKSSSSNSSGDGASLNGTSSTASVGTPEFQRSDVIGLSDGTARAAGGIPSHRSCGNIPPAPPPPPPTGTASPTTYIFSNTSSSMSPRHRSPSPASPYGESMSTFSPHVLRPPSAFSSGGVSLVSEHGAVNTALYDPQPSRCVWPPGSIPKRVKKLSWQDELYSQTELDPEVSVTPMPHRTAQHQQHHQHSNDSPGLTVYF
ncbi:Cadherin [Trinorchestia longiramus]|nr:Cadherin [Trinorchestia longiramus]